MRSIVAILFSAALIGAAYQIGVSPRLAAQSKSHAQVQAQVQTPAAAAAQEKDKTICDNSGKTKGANAKCSCNRPCDPTTKKPQRDLRDGKPHCDNDCKEDLCHCPTQCDKGT